MDYLLPIVELLEKGKIADSSEKVTIYEKSYKEHEGVHLLMVKDTMTKYLLVAGIGKLFEDLNGKDIGSQGKACQLTYENRLVLNRYFDFTVPQAFGTKLATIGLGDRLGLASPGHIQTVEGRKVK